VTWASGTPLMAVTPYEVGVNTGVAAAYTKVMYGEPGTRMMSVVALFEWENRRMVRVCVSYQQKQQSVP